MCLDYCKYTFPKGEYKQPEDNLAHYMIYNPEIDAYYKQISPYYDDWKNGKKNSYSPLEIHAVLSYATNKWMGKQVTSFSQNVPIDSIFEEITEKERPVIISGNFSGLNHIVVLVGVIYNKKNTVQETLKQMPESVIYDDPFGKTYEYNKGLSGNDCIVPFNKFLDDVKPLKETRYKWAHVFPVL
jgi:hypothetical protein